MSAYQDFTAYMRWTAPRSIAASLALYLLHVTGAAAGATTGILILLWHEARQRLG